MGTQSQETYDKVRELQPLQNQGILSSNIYYRGSKLTIVH